MRRARLARLALLLAVFGWLVPLTAIAAGPTPDAVPAALHGAGLVVRHGDGRVLYLYVPFDEPSISGAELLQRSRLALTLSPFAGLGVAVCSLDNEGCPASDCFCKSYGQPSMYWHFYRLAPDGKWSPSALGPSEITIHPGDIEGWGWDSGDNQLPPTSFRDIARLNGLLPLATPHATATPEPATSAVAAVATSVGTAEARGVEVAPGGTVRAVQPAPHEGGPRTGTLVLFGALVVLVLLAGLAAVLRRRARRAP